MELTKTGRLRRNEQLSKTMASAKTTQSNPINKTKQTQSQTKADKLALSQQAVTYLEERNRYFQEKSQRKQNRLEQDMQKWTEKTALLDSMEKQMKIMSKCNKISSRIIKGDRVPPQDLNYLRECDPDGYRLALAMRRPKKHPKKWETVLDDEDQKNREQVPNPAAKPSRTGTETESPTSSADTVEPASPSGESGTTSGGPTP